MSEHIGRHRPKTLVSRSTAYHVSQMRDLMAQAYGYDYQPRHSAAHRPVTFTGSSRVEVAR